MAWRCAVLCSVVMGCAVLRRVLLWRVWFYDPKIKFHWTGLYQIGIVLYEGLVPVVYINVWCGSTGNKKLYSLRALAIVRGVVD